MQYLKTLWHLTQSGNAVTLMHRLKFHSQLLLALVEKKEIPTICRITVISRHPPAKAGKISGYFARAWISGKGNGVFGRRD